MIEVSRLKDLNAAKLFLGFRIGAIRRRDFAVFPVQGQRSLRRLKRYFGDKMSVGAQMVVVLKAIVERCMPLVLGHPFEFSLARDIPNRCISLFFTSSFRVGTSGWLHAGSFIPKSRRVRLFRCSLRVRHEKKLTHLARRTGELGRGPISKQRNGWLQTALIEAAKLAP